MHDRDNDIVWRPTPARIEVSNMLRFARAAGFGPDEVWELHRWSVELPASFHDLLWDQLEIIGDKGAVSFEPGPSLIETKIFPEARLNYAENLLANPDASPAISAVREDGTRRRVTRADLYDLVSRLVQALRSEGIVAGDRIAAIVTNDVEAIAFYLASATIGAIWASCSPDFGPRGASDRLCQVDPTLLIAVSGATYGGKAVDTTASINAVAAHPSVRRIVLVGEPRGDYAKPAVALDSWVAPFAPGPIAFNRLPFDAPMVIMFTSGTTGKPKCIVHRAGGLLLAHKKEHVLHCDLQSGERLFYYTTCGWMMWNWLVTGLASRATVVTYDGSPMYPSPTRMADLIDAEQVTIFGTSAKYIDSCQKAELVPRRTHSLASLKAVLSTGSPLLPHCFDYVHADWKPDVHLASISGGTDICGCFLGGNPLLPVRRGELQGPILGMDMAVFDAQGHASVGAPGELVCRNAHASMPLGFWGDGEDRLYRASYFERFPGVWAHGDFAEARPSGGYVIHGRSDSTLKPGGVRIGTAEIYRQVETIPEVLEALAVGQDWRGDQRIILFVRLRDGTSLTATLEDEIRRSIREGATPRHVPALIISVADFPRTRSGKVSEIAVRNVINDKPIDNDTALINPDCLLAFRNLPQIAR